MVAPLPSKLDQRQILQGVYDEDRGLLRTSVTSTIVNADIAVAIDSATGDNVAIKSLAGIELKINPTGSIDVVEGVKTGGVYGNLSMVTANTQYEAKVGASALTSRKALFVTATSTGIYWGTDISVTTSTGTPLMNNQTLSITIDPNSTFKVFLVSSNASSSARIVEVP